MKMTKVQYKSQWILQMEKKKYKYIKNLMNLMLINNIKKKNKLENYQINSCSLIKL